MPTPWEIAAQKLAEAQQTHASLGSALAPYVPPAPQPVDAPDATPTYGGGGDELVDFQGGKIAAGNRSIFEDISKRFGLRFTNGYRDPAHNKAVGGVDRSWHLKGYAGDWVGSAKAMQDALAYARAHYNPLEALVHNVGSGQHFHLAVRPQGGAQRPNSFVQPQQSFGTGRVGQVSGLSPAEAWIIQHESGGNPLAYNKTPVYSGGKLLGNAWGIGQIVDNRPISQRPHDVATQLAIFRNYVKQRYGNAEKAKAFWQAHNWY